MTTNLLSNYEFIKRCYEGITETGLSKKGKITKEDVDKEQKRGNNLIGQSGNGQRTTLLCENAVKEALEKLGYKNVRNTEAKKSTVRDKKYKPDFESDEVIREVKGRNWTISGTAGEKILGSPLKYSEVPSLFQKPLKIVVVGYQEREAKNGFAFGDLLDISKGRTKEASEMIEFYKQKSIEFIGFTQLLQKLGLNDGCWIGKIQ